MHSASFKICLPPNAHSFLQQKYSGRLEGEADSYLNVNERHLDRRLHNVRDQVHGNLAARSQSRTLGGALVSRDLFLPKSH